MSTTLPSDVSLNGLNFTRAQEGRALRAYQDSVGVWTVGYGLTNYDKNLPWKIGKGLTITEDQAEWYLLKAIRDNYMPACRKALDGGTYQHPQGALDGAIDFHFNTGGISRATWPKALASGDLSAAKESLLSWNKAGGRVLSGLVRRREGNWQEVSAGSYGNLRGPDVIEPGANNRERETGVGDILTAFPPDPNDPNGYNAAIDGIPQPTRPAPGVLQYGDQGPAMLEIQNDLSSAGFPTTASGSFDDATLASVHAFQQAHPNLSDDGKVGPATRAAIQRAIAMRSAANKIVKVAAPSIPGAFIALHQWVNENASYIALTAAVAVVSIVIGYYLWKHRLDAVAWLNKVRGRIVP